MDQNQINEVTLVLNNLKAKDIEEELSEHFADQENIKSIILHTLTVSDFIVHFKKAIRKLEAAILSDKVHFMPFQYNFQNEFGHGNLQTLLTAILTAIDGKDFQNTEVYTTHLIHYEIVNGIYEQPQFPKNYLRIEKINDAEEKLGFLGNQIDKYSENISEALSNLDTARNALEEFHAAKRQELQNITDLVATATTQNNQITELLNSSTQLNSQSELIHEQQEKVLKNTEQLLSEQKTAYTDYDATIESLIKDVNNNIDTAAKQILKFDEKLKFVENKTDYFEKRNTYLNNLIGREVGTNLFLTFNNRKKELGWSARIWAFLVFAAAALAVYVIFLIFNPTNFTEEISDAESLLRFFLFNGIKTVPFIYFLYFSILQYTRERSYQEEYAFKSAVALTIDAYKELIKDGPKKDDFVIESVLGIYNPPIEGKVSSLRWLRKLSKSLREMKGITKSLDDFNISIKSKGEEQEKEK